jgi:hypothetical protein
MEPENLQQLEMLIGPDVKLLIASREATERHLDDPDAKLRWASVMLLVHHWGFPEEFKKKCEEIAFHDPDQKVRSGALGALGTLFSGTYDRRIGKLLASVVCNNSENYSNRVSAYRSLLRVSRATGQDIFRESFINLKIPEDIDWQVVESYRKMTDG